LISLHEIKYEDIDKGFLAVLENLVLPDIDNNEYAKNILQKIKMNSLHKIFVAEDDSNGNVVGTITLLIEPKFINKGMQVGYIEDVSVRKGYEGLGIGSKTCNLCYYLCHLNRRMQKNIVILFRKN